MPHYFCSGAVPPKRHIQFRQPGGEHWHEEVFGTEGFSGPTSTLYHSHPPTQVTSCRPLCNASPVYVETNILRMRHMRTHQLAAQGDPISGRVPLLGNSDTIISACSPQEQMSYFYRNAQGDECLFIEQGSGVLHTSFGRLNYREHDLVVVPRGTTYSVEPQKVEGPLAKSHPYGRMMIMETANGSHILPPPRYLAKRTGQFLEHAPYCERDLRTPEAPRPGTKSGPFEVRVKAMGWLHAFEYPYHPLDVGGWDGCLYPFAFNVHDFAPIVGALHMPPPIHQVFEAHNMVICAFCPRPLDFHPQAVRVPYNHFNVDSDEVMFYVEGTYTARKGIERGSMTLHPHGIAHGPHPGTLDGTLNQDRTDELAIMCDTFAPLMPTAAALEIDDASYTASWSRSAPAPGRVPVSAANGSA